MATKKKPTCTCNCDCGDLQALPPPLNTRNIMCAFLGQDPDVTVTVDKEAKNINIIVGGCELKTAAMRRLFKGKITVGTQEYDLLVNGHKKTYHNKVDAATIRAALTGNPYVNQLYIQYRMKKMDKWVLLVEPEVIQFPNDNAGSPYGLETMSAEQLAREALRGKLDGTVLPVSSMTYFPFAQNQWEEAEK